LSTPCIDETEEKSKVSTDDSVKKLSTNFDLSFAGNAGESVENNSKELREITFDSSQEFLKNAAISSI
jgi:hypothetical protein